MKIALLFSLVLASAVAPAHAHQHGGGQGHAGAMHASGAKTANIQSAPVSQSIAVSGCWIRAIPAPAPSGGYFLVRNQGQSAVSLVAASSPSYRMVMLHQTTHSDGMSRMSEVEAIAIEPGSELAFKPGGYHAMLEGAAKDVKVDGSIALNLLFDNGEKAVVDCEVKPANTRVPN